MGNEKNISFFYRKKRPGAFSIEELFYSIERQLIKEGYTAERHELPHSGASPKHLLENIDYCKKNQSAVNHITGETQYIALGLGRNSVMTVHDVGSALHGNPIKNLIIKLLWFWVPSLIVKKITVISEFSRSELNKLIPWAKHKIHVVHNPVNGEILKNAHYKINIPTPENGVFKILHLGTKVNKNLFRTIDALKDLPCELTIIGTLTDEHLNKLKESGIKYISMANITFPEIIGQYQKADIICFASTYEGFGMPIIEAQTLGKPIITSNVASMPEIAGESAVLVDPFSVESIRKGILSLMENESFRIQKIEQGYKNVQRFMPENICKIYIEIYKSINKNLS